jgi:hypothetical protein
MDASADNNTASGADTGGDGRDYAGLVGWTLVSLVGVCTLATVVFGVVYGAESSPADEFAALTWLLLSVASALAALVFLVVAICYGVILHVVRRRRARRAAIA